LIESAKETIPHQEAKDFANYISSLTGLFSPYIQASAIKRQNNLDPFISLGKLLIENH
jgi:hypothetical protein